MRIVAVCVTRCHRLKAVMKTWRLWGWDVTSNLSWAIYSHCVKIDPVTVNIIMLGLVFEFVFDLTVKDSYMLSVWASQSYSLILALSFNTTIFSFAMLGM